MEEWEIRLPLIPKTPEPMVTKFGLAYDVRTPTTVQNFISIR